MSETKSGLPGRQYAGLWVGLIIALLFALVIPLRSDQFWLTLFTQAVVFAIAAAGVGVLYGRLGIVSLNQVALLGFGGWFYLRFGYLSEGIPSPLLLIIAGACTMVLGVLIGLPSLRLSGLSLAIVTLMFASAAQVFFNAFGFPVGNEGWSGDEAGGATSQLARPSWLESNTAVWWYTVIVAAVLFLVIWGFLKGRAGRAWAAIRQSEPGAASVGVNITGNKMLALAVVSFTTGVAGGLLAVPNGRLDAQYFSAILNIQLFAVVLIGGAFSLVGAVLAGLLNNAFPSLLEYVVKTIPPLYNFFGAAFTNLILVLFGAGLIQALVTSPRGMAGNFAGLGQALNTLFTGPRGFVTVKYWLIIVILPIVFLLAFGAVTAIVVTFALWIAIWFANWIRGFILGKGTNKVLFWVLFVIMFAIPLGLMVSMGTFNGTGSVFLSTGVNVDKGLQYASWFLFIVWLVLIIVGKFIQVSRARKAQAALREAAHA